MSGQPKSAEEVLGPDPWKLLLVVEDRDAMRVAVAYYALPKKQRKDLERISELTGISHELDQILTRLRVAGLLDHDELPQVLRNMIAQRVVTALTKKG